MLLLVFLAVNFRVPSIYFQQDEWHGFGTLIGLGSELIFHRFDVTEVSHFVPLNSLISLLVFRFLSFNHAGYNLFGLFFHFLSVLLLFYVANRVFKDKILAFLAAFLFTVNSSYYQLVGWPFISLNILSLVLSLVSWIFLLNFLNGKNAAYNGFFSSVFLFLALIDSEYSAGMILFIPIVSLVLSKRTSKDRFCFLLPHILFMTFYALLRFSGMSSLSVDSVTFDFKYLWLLPINYLSQSLFIRQFLHIFPESLYFSIFWSHAVVVSIFSILFSGVVILLIEFTSFIKRKRKDRVTFLMFLFFTVCSSLPFLMVVNRNSVYPIFYSRYLYFGALGVSLLMTFWIKKIVELRGRFFKLFVFLILLIFVLMGILGGFRSYKNLYEVGLVRKSILDQIDELDFEFKHRQVWYVESDSSYYGLPADYRILPFQSGFGQLLMVYFYSDRLPKEFFKSRFLWDIDSQGYREYDGYGFGFYRDFNELVDAIKANSLDINSVLAFSYDSRSGDINDISEQLRGRVRGYFSRGAFVEKFSISSELSANLINYANDKSRDTYWDSGLPYSHPQYIDIELDSVKEIVGIRIDSYNNKDQDKVGYEILVSKDRENWDNVFRSLVIPPDDEGFADLYFEPSGARYIRINQIGRHEFASWVIHEIKIYEINK